jgi:hypothetical protein
VDTAIPPAARRPTRLAPLRPPFLLPALCLVALTYAGNKSAALIGPMTRLATRLAWAVPIWAHASRRPRRRRGEGQDRTKLCLVQPERAVITQHVVVATGLWHHGACILFPRKCPLALLWSKADPRPASLYSFLLCYVIPGSAGVSANPTAAPYLALDLFSTQMALS